MSMLSQLRCICSITNIEHNIANYINIYYTYAYTICIWYYLNVLYLTFCWHDHFKMFEEKVKWNVLPSTGIELNFLSNVIYYIDQSPLLIRMVQPISHQGFLSCCQENLCHSTLTPTFRNFAYSCERQADCRKD